MFTFHLGFIHPLQDIALYQCLPLSPVCCSPVPGGSLLPCFVVLACHLLLGRPLDIFPPLDHHSVQCLIYLLPFILAVCPTHFHFCFSVCSIMSNIFVLFQISEHGVYYLVALNLIFISPLLFEQFSVFFLTCLLRDRVWQP